MGAGSVRAQYDVIMNTVSQEENPLYYCAHVKVDCYRAPVSKGLSLTNYFNYVKECLKPNINERFHSTV